MCYVSSDVFTIRGVIPNNVALSVSRALLGTVGIVVIVLCRWFVLKVCVKVTAFQSVVVEWSGSVKCSFVA